MSIIQKIKSGRIITVESIDDFIGNEGQIFYEEGIGELRLSDGVTPGGIILSGGAGTATLRVSLVSGSTYTNTVTNVTGLRFDSDSGFDVVNLGGGNVKIAINSTFKFWDVNGSPGLVAEGLDTVNFVASTGTNIVAYTTGSNKSLTFSVNTATKSSLGGIIVGSGLDITPDGTLSVDPEVSSNLVWTSNVNYRTLTAYRESGTEVPVRTAEFFNNLLRLTLASFSPTFTATPIPSASLNWDVPATGFNVSVDNPADFTSSYISSVLSITATAGVSNNLNQFTAGAYSATPAGGVDWNRSFTNGSIKPISSTISGGSAACRVGFNVTTNAVETPYTTNSATFTINWVTPSMSVTLGSLSGQTFLGSYTSVSYTVSVTGMASAANYQDSVSAVGGIVSNPTGSGTFTFTTPIHKNNASDTRTVSNSTLFIRPVEVTGVSYLATITNTTSNPSTNFTYPSFWIFTTSTSFVPTRAAVVQNFGFENAVTVLGNQVKTFSGIVNNQQANPQAFWFGIRSSASQPTNFRTGASASLLSAVAYTTGTVALEPDSPGVGYIAENYSLYGITLQPGNTYVDIG